MIKGWWAKKSQGVIFRQNDFFFFFSFLTFTPSTFSINRNFSHTKHPILNKRGDATAIAHWGGMNLPLERWLGDLRLAYLISLEENFQNILNEITWNYKLASIHWIYHEIAIITLFLPPGFSRVSAHKTRQLEPSRVDLRKAQLHLRTLKTQPGAHFSRFGKVWPELTKFDQSLTKTLTGPKARFDELTPDHWIRHIKSFNSELYGSKTDEKRESYGQNHKNWFNT